MISFMSKKKKYKFQVTLVVEELSSMTFPNGIFFAKVRLHEGGNFLDHSSRETVRNNSVKWNSKFPFTCKMMANATTGLLESCICRVSVRMEVRGGRSHQKLGFVDLNLAEFAGSGQQTRRFLLEGYDDKHRVDNSTLTVSIEMLLISGDPVFKVPIKESLNVPESKEGQSAEGRLGDECSEGSLASNSSGFGSLPRKEKSSTITRDQSDPEFVREKEFEKGHSRSSSYASQHSRGSGYGSLTHSRQSSAGNEISSTHVSLPTMHLPDTASTPKFQRCNFLTPSTGSSLEWKAERRRVSQHKMEESGKELRVDQTRVNAEALVDELLQGTDLGPVEKDEESSQGLQLIVSKDGTTALW
ncbi:protein FAM102B-like isoform X1 [Haliotis rubra]|uniref:protein FAM102B-like isoform X1 n=1 Tax=Haliotis rubra TaxID=36100 RepID=UPI001EE544D4|nr:protein FAM102B-like isoform X1 [Haliotis rubra]